MQEQCRRADVLGRLDEGQERRRDERRADSLLVEDRVRERCEREQDEGRQSAADELDEERLPEEAPKTAPVPGGDVAEAVLRQRLLHREVEERLEEPDHARARS